MSIILRTVNNCKIREFIAWILRNILSYSYIFSIALFICSTRVPKAPESARHPLHKGEEIHGRTPAYVLVHRPADSLQSFRHTWLSALSVTPSHALSKCWTFKVGSSAGTAEKMETKPYFIPLTLESARGNLIHTAIYSSLAAQEVILAAEKHQSLRSFSTSPKSACMQGLEREQY